MAGCVSHVVCLFVCQGDNGERRWTLSYLWSPARRCELGMDCHGGHSVRFQDEPFPEAHHFLPVISETFLCEMRAADPDTVQVFECGRRSVVINEVDPLLTDLRILGNIME